MKKILTLTILALLVTGAATVAFADYDFEGTGEGDPLPGTQVIPWSVWEGTVHTGDNPYFSGCWSNDVDNGIYAKLSYNSQTGVYTVIVDQYNYWEYDNTAEGQWSGSFYPPTPNDTASGYWWMYPPDSSSCHGTWAGDRADG